ncbi:MAG: ABC transporter, partial [Ruthenibacterium sp.]
HILTEIQAVCERVVVLDGGRIVADDTPQNLENALQSKESSLAVIEGEPETVLAVLRAIPGIRQAECLLETEPGAHEYKLCGSE